MSTPKRSMGGWCWPAMLVGSLALVQVAGCRRAPKPGPAEDAAARSAASAAPSAVESLGAASRFGIDYVFPLQAEFRRSAWARTLAATGAGWANLADVRWERIEPKPPRGSRHRYHWSELDEAVRIWQGAGFSVVFSLRMGNGWFAGPIRYRPVVKTPLVGLFVRNSDRLPAPEHQPSYRAWIQALVERYDGDGQHDMPELASPILHYQVGNEFANPMYWTGTLQDYETLLKETRSAARKAHSDVRIISNGIRWNDLFHGDPGAVHFDQRFAAFLARLPSDDWRSEWRRVRKITEGTVALAPHYDIFDAGGNGPYPTMSQGYMTWVRRELAQTGASPTIWDMEARSEPYLVAEPNLRFHASLHIPGGERLLRILKNRSHPQHERIQVWYRAEQARILVKVFATRFAAGFEKVFMGMPSDWDGTVATLSTPNPFIGLMDRKGRPWPALRALGELVPAIDGFRAAQKRPAPAGVELYRFSFARGRQPVWLAWLEPAETLGPDDALPQQRVRLEAIATPAVAQRIPTADEEPTPVRFADGQPLVLDLDPTPVIVVEQSR